MALLDDLKLFEMDSDSDVTPEVIQDRYYELIRKYPPEKYPDLFVSIQQAYERLKDPQKSFFEILESYDNRGNDITIPNESSGEEIFFRFPLDKLLMLGK